MLAAHHLFGFSKALGGAHASRSMMPVEMRALVRAMPAAAARADFTNAVIDGNVLEKPTLVSQSIRHLTELYGLDSSKALFRVLWDLAHADPESLDRKKRTHL